MDRDSYRSFSPELEALAGGWSDLAMTAEQWQDLGPFGASESKPFRVSNGTLVGLAKPGEKKTDGIARPAHEKIVSDLAFTLKLVWADDRSRRRT